MKKLIITACCLTIMGMSAAFAQIQMEQDSENVESQAPYEAKVNRYFQSDMVLVNNVDVPEEIQNTLQSDEYKGWKKGRMFTSPGHDTYILEVEDDGKTNVYRFDNHGKRLKDE